MTISLRSQRLKKRPTIMIVGPQGDGIRALHLFLSSFFRNTGIYKQVINYIDIEASFKEKGDILGCFNLAQQADQMIVVLGRDPGRLVKRSDVEAKTHIVMAQEESPFTEMEVRAFLAHDDRAKYSLYVLARKELYNTTVIETNPDWPRFFQSVKFLNYLQTKADNRNCFTLGPDLRGVLGELVGRLNIPKTKYTERLSLYKAKKDYQDAVYAVINDPSLSCNSYLSVVGHWSMLTATQMDWLKIAKIKEMAMIGPKVTSSTLPGLLQRIWVNACRKAQNLVPITLLAFQGDPPFRFVTFGDQGFIQSAAPRQHLTTHLHITGNAAYLLVDMFRTMALECSPAIEDAFNLIKILAEVEFNVKDFQKLVEADKNLQRKLHAAIIKETVESVNKAKDPNEILDPNLYEFTDCHITSILRHLYSDPGLQRKYRVSSASSINLSNRVPDLRFIATSSCNSNCVYCPLGNEDYEQFDPTMEVPLVDAFKVVAMAAENLKVNTLALTGGEPTSSTKWQEALKAAAEYTKKLSFQLQTSGFGLENGTGISTLTELSDRIRIKLSMDPQHSSTSKSADNFLDHLISAKFPLDRIVINFVCDRTGFSELGDYIKKFAILGISIKILDLIWYDDIGNRLPSDPQVQGESFFNLHYQNMEEVRNLLDKEGYNLIEKVDKTFGVVEQLFQNQKGHKILLRDSSYGTTYYDVCFTCPLFASNLCQEGKYQLEITSVRKLKICKHRPDLARSIDKEIREDIRQKSFLYTRNALANMFQDYYRNLLRITRFNIVSNDEDSDDSRRQTYY